MFIIEITHEFKLTDDDDDIIGGVPEAYTILQRNTHTKKTQ